MKTEILVVPGGKQLNRVTACNELKLKHIQITINSYLSGTTPIPSTWSRCGQLARLTHVQPHITLVALTCSPSYGVQ